jgi:acetyl-CoA carboxylase carboxyl transferase subunit alpha
MRHFLDFEKPIANLEGKVEELRHMSTDGSINIADEIGKLQTRIERELKQTYEKLGAWEKVQVARHPDRPKFATFSTGFLMILPRLPVIVIFPKITRSLAAWRGSAASR